MRSRGLAASARRGRYCASVPRCRSASAVRRTQRVRHPDGRTDHAVIDASSGMTCGSSAPSTQSAVFLREVEAEEPVALDVIHSSGERSARTWVSPSRRSSGTVPRTDHRERPAPRRQQGLGHDRTGPSPVAGKTAGPQNRPCPTPARAIGIRQRRQQLRVEAQQGVVRTACAVRNRIGTAISRVSTPTVIVAAGFAARQPACDHRVAIIAAIPRAQA